MGIKAPTTVEVSPTMDSGAEAAIKRLQETKTEPTPQKKYNPSDSEEIARGKTRCQMYNSALMSPAVAGMKWKTEEEFFALIRRIADNGVAYSFGDK